MGKKKSLGSSPIGFGSGNSSKMDFIPDLGVSDSKQKKEPPKKEQRNTSNGFSTKSTPSQSQPSLKEEKAKKKVVSYNLDITLVEKIKSTAEEKEMYYSGLVNKALKSWFANQALD
ncbi:hypothetical protein [Fodinibius saliphilus]|uniref:hypothetical protein n=1 Tax=Fodinibius saliphilus TaxID=1920650 RepID=UPI001107C386|nr:hypothetical protein [Fodinibius saliphilus]